MRPPTIRTFEWPSLAMPSLPAAFVPEIVWPARSTVIPSAPMTSAVPGQCTRSAESVVLVVSVAPQVTAGAVRGLRPAHRDEQPQPGDERQPRDAHCAHLDPSSVSVVVVRGRPSQEAATGPLPVAYRPPPGVRSSPGTRLPHPGPARGELAGGADPPRRPPAEVGPGDPAAGSRTGSCRSTASPRSCTAGRPRSARSRRCTARSRSCGCSWSRGARPARPGRSSRRARPATGSAWRRTRSTSCSSSASRTTPGRRWRRATPRRPSALYRQALAQWRGAPLADLAFEPFARPVIERLSDLRLTIVERCLGAELELGRGAELVAELEQLVLDNPLDERLRGQLMVALYRAGRQADALERFRRGTRRARGGVRPRAHARAEGARAAGPPAGSQPRCAPVARPSPPREDAVRTVLLAGVGRRGAGPSGRRREPPRRARPPRAARDPGRAARGAARRRRVGHARPQRRPQARRASRAGPPPSSPAPPAPTRRGWR